MHNNVPNMTLHHIIYLGLSIGDKISSTLVVKQTNQNPIESSCNIVFCNSCFNEKSKGTNFLFLSDVIPN